MLLLDEIMKEKIGFSPTQSAITLHSQEEWEGFQKHYGMPQSVRGVYDIERFTSHLQQGDLVTFFHEHYGHGTFFEHSLLGQTLREDALRVPIHERQHVLDEHPNSRISEGFAIWSEQMLTRAHNDPDLKRKSSTLFLGYSREDQESYTDIVRAESFGNLYIRRHCGFPHTPTTAEAREVIQKIFPDKNIDIAILYGSKKNTSDVDLFIVGENIHDYKNHWLDIVGMQREEFSYYKNNLLPLVTDPLYSGEVLIGEKEVMQLRESLHTMPITHDMIEANRRAATWEQEIIDKGILHGKDLDVARGYVRTFTTNALLLEQGKRYMTKKQLEGYYA
jgi:hypothetical protein